MRNFHQYLFEKTDKKVLIILTNPSTAKNQTNNEMICKDEWKIKEICEKINQPYHILFQNNLYFEKLDDKIKIINSRFEEPEEIVLEPEQIRVLIRSNLSSNGKAFYDFLKDLNIFIINSKECIEICGDKFETERILKENDISTTESMIVSDENSLSSILDKFKNKFPVVLKTIRGSLGKGVMKISNKEELLPILQTIWTLNDDMDIIIQKYYEIDGDIRTFIIGDKIIASMKRKKLKNDFRSNITLGADAVTYKLSEKEKDIVLKAHKTIGADYSGVDHIIVDNKPIIIEVNSCAGTTGIDKITGSNVTKKLIDYTLNGYIE